MTENKKENGNEIGQKEIGKQDRDGPAGFQDPGNEKDFEKTLTEIRERKFPPHGRPDDWSIWISSFKGSNGGTYIMIGHRIKEAIKIGIAASLAVGAFIVLF